MEKIEIILSLLGGLFFIVGLCAISNHLEDDGYSKTYDEPFNINDLTGDE